MAATPKGPQRMKLDWMIDRQTYDVFVKQCGQKGYAPQVIVERMMKKYIETGQI
jgi:hypothetical protein